MAIPHVYLTANDDLKWCFKFLPSGLFTASLDSTFVTITSKSARIYSCTSSFFEVFFEQALFQFPHAELKKFKEFLMQVDLVKEAA